MLGLTQEKLAEETGISGTYVGQIERGERSLTLDTLIKISNRLGVTIDYLLIDSIKTNDESLLKQWLRIMDGRTSREKKMVIDIIKLMFGY